MAVEEEACLREAEADLRADIEEDLSREEDTLTEEATTRTTEAVCTTSNLMLDTVTQVTSNSHPLTWELLLKDKSQYSRFLQPRLQHLWELKRERT